MKINSIQNNNTNFGMALKINPKLKPQLLSAHSATIERLQKIGKEAENVKLYDVCYEKDIYIPSVRSVVNQDDKAKIFVKNACNVIPPEKLNKLFEKFIRLDDNTTRTTRGTGLGLFIVKGLVEAMNGEIKLHSDENCGFCVELTLNLSNAVEVV